MKIKATKKDNFSFQKGYYSLPNSKMGEFRKNVMDSLNISRESFYRRMRGETELKVSEAQIIEDIFNRYNITNIWGDK